MKTIKKIIGAAYSRHLRRCEDWSGQRIAKLKPKKVLDVGCGDGSLLLKYIPRYTEIHGVEGCDSLRSKAAAAGIRTASFDLNGRWFYHDNQFDAIHCAQVIEHLHNTKLFLVEMLRVLKPGGRVLLTSENLSSILNTGAMILGYAPFTLSRCCGSFIGNPVGLHSGEDIATDAKIDDPAFAGITGHVRALSFRQAAELFRMVGFVDVNVSTMCLLPLPEFLLHVMPTRGHLLMVEAQKPHTMESFDKYRSEKNKQTL